MSGFLGRDFAKQNFDTGTYEWLKYRYLWMAQMACLCVALVHKGDKSGNVSAMSKGNKTKISSQEMGSHELLTRNSPWVYPSCNSFLVWNYKIILKFGSSLIFSSPAPSPVPLLSAFHREVLYLANIYLSWSIFLSPFCVFIILKLF